MTKWDEEQEKKIEGISLSKIDIINGKIITSKTMIRISSIFDWIIIFSVIINTILQACDTPLDNPNSIAS